MPPKKRRGGARGRRGRPPKKGAQPETELTATHSPQDSPIFEQTETSSSNSSALEEPAPETKVKLETKIHKKFGIKYHVPDEVGKSLSPQLHVEEAASPATDKHEVQTSEESSSAVENEADEKMHTEDAQECIEDEITEQMHQLGVTGTVETCVIDNVAEIPMQMQEDEATVIEYETECDQESEIIEGEVAVEGESFQEVYYVIEETNESIPEEHEHEHDDTVNIPEENVTQEEPEIKMEVENVPEEPEKAKEKKKDEVKQKDPKIPEKPCRKSKRLSLKSNKLAEVQETPVKPQISPKEEKDDVKEESEVMQEVSSTIENECKPENEIKIEEIAKTSPTEDIDSIDETINEVIEASDIEPEIKSKKKAAEKKKIVKTKKKDLKDKDKDQEVETPQTEKKKSKKVTFKTQPKGKKGLKSPQQTPDKKSDEEDNNIRRSSRIKTISTQKVRSRGKGLVKKDDILESHSKSTPDDKIFVAPTSTTDVEHHKPVKVKSRWRRSSELEMRDIVKTPLTDSPVNEKDIEKKKNDSTEVERRSKQFHHLKENVYLTERISCKEAKKMLCDCFLTEEEIAQGEYGCGDDCLNRLLMIECGNLCTVGERCTNKRFQKMQGATIEAFATEKKGLGIRAVANIPSGDFILEYVGEVLDAEKFEQRAAEYSKDKNQHYYFMALRADAVIDATMKGNISRFINHSCEPNAETQKWTVNGELRIGFFSKRTILAGEEITFDYQFQRYGKEAQKCFCEAPNCRGWLGEEPDSDEESEEDEDEEDEEEDEEEEEEVKDEVTEETKEEKSEEKPGAEEAGIKVPPVVKSPKKPKPPKKERKLRELKPRRKPRLDRFEDLGLDEEIESLQSTGLKNQAQTLKLSRLMVRAKEPVQRTKLLKLLKKGEFPCRRLFLDYHGLKLIHGWMTDAQHLARKDPSMESLRLEILQTLAMLPIPNKTMLQDSKVLPTVEKWSKDSEDQESPADSDSNSPKDTEQSSQEDKEDKKISVSSEDSTRHTAKPLEYSKKSKDTKIATQVKIVDDDEVRKSTGMECGYCKLIPDYNVGIKDELMIIFDDDFVPLEVPVKVAKHVEPEPKYDFRVEVIALALKLLEEWASLKEVFRIPKKERIEQMKEHEREADRRYKALTVEQETERKRDRYRGFQRLSRIEITNRLNKDRDRERDIRDRSKNDRYNHIQVPMSKMSKHERRELFARQAQEEERRRKQEMWSKQNWMVMGQDPRLQNFDPTRNMQLMWNPQIAQYQNIVADPSMTSFNYPPGMFRPGLPGPQTHMETPHGIQSLPSGIMPPTLPPGQPNLATLPPMTTMPPNMARPLPFAENDPSKVQFMGPIPPPVVLPAKWKCAKDIYGRPYYYHIRMRKAQWEPPDVTSSRLDEEGEEEEEESESSSSSDTSSLTSTSSSEDSDSEDDTRLMMDIRNKFRRLEQQKLEAIAAAKRAAEDVSQPLMGTDEAVSNLLTLSDSMLPTDDMNISDLSVMTEMMDRSMAEEAASPLEAQFLLGPPAKKRRVGLVQEHIISPRSEEDRLQFREDVKKYKLNKEMVRKQKDILLQQSKKQIRQGAPPPAHPPTNGDKHAKQHKRKVSTKTKLKEMEANANTEETKKIKEAFRTAMATVMVSILNPYRKSDCKEGRITATEDFKHLARKLTHFVMLKELKHCDRIEELDCTDSVKAKAKEFVRKYMAKFGEVYKRPVDETDHLN